MLILIPWQANKYEYPSVQHAIEVRLVGLQNATVEGLALLVTNVAHIPLFSRPQPK